ncbi:MAG: hypothetical protein ACRDVE_20920, partial [Actinocrinis sp.]
MPSGSAPSAAAAIEAAAGSTTADSAPRVVMLVANGVVGDSRVQKIAWSMADAGWRVTLIGRASGTEAESFRIKDADVVLVPVPKVVSGYEKTRLRGGAAARRAEYRRARAALAARDAG